MYSYNIIRLLFGQLLVRGHRVETIKELVMNMVKNIKEYNKHTIDFKIKYQPDDQPSNDHDFFRITLALETSQIRKS